MKPKVFPHHLKQQPLVTMLSATAASTATRISPLFFFSLSFFVSAGGGSISSSSSSAAYPSMEAILSSSRSPIILRQPRGEGHRNLTPPSASAGPRSAAEAAADHDRLKLPQSTGGGGGGRRDSRNSSRPKNFKDWICIRKPQPATTPAREQSPSSCCCGCCPTCCRSKSRHRPELWQPEGERLQMQPQSRSASPPYAKSGGGGGGRASRGRS